MIRLHKEKMLMYADVELVFRTHMRSTRDTYGLREQEFYLGSKMYGRLPLLHDSCDGLLCTETIRRFEYISVHFRERKEI